MRRYYSLSDYFKEKYGCKILKLSINGGFTCPNRINGLKGCLFCSDLGSGEFGGDSNLSIKEQISRQKNFLKHKNKSNKYIAYFQSFTNTFDKIENLKNKYYEALNCDTIIGLAIATRPDCIDDEVIDLLKKINEKYELWLELGFQTSKEETANIIRRGYSNQVLINAVRKLNSAGIKVVTHLIFGLPYENKTDWINSVNFISRLNLWGVKFHSLYIQKNSDLYTYYLNNNFKVISKDEYTDMVSEAISLIPKNYVVHRLTGDADKKQLYLPKWSADKLSVIGLIQKKLKDNNIVQGINYNY
ncbi:TIGR01212 family radical SAM protein [Miniphocaeibacter halophilus]|uniref:TIGR01212 family radical SAM protein n=1 Tax=Miniphocaeibacter halophilus TaxID=2931922 RepID=A0AC61N561_9FIRM|nr:TIGR01212 family radical SAM protein [Miniphocaeibacter halophilus]QQK08018.1 TIGR01212 family radical SAM protein [Miniphocaeibacter halophilus]